MKSITATTRKELKKEIITNEAQKIFARYGLAKTSVDEIAKAARMGKASLYHYFESKEDIFKEVVEAEMRALTEKIRQAVSRQSTPQKKIKANIMVSVEQLGQMANIKSALEDSYLDHHAFIKEIREKVFIHEIENIKEILHEGVKSGAFKIRDIELTSFVIVAAIKSLLLHPRTQSLSAAEKERGIDKLLELLFDGIGKR